MSTIAERARISRYKGGLNIPNLICKTPENIKIGDRFYFHSTTQTSNRYLQLLPLELVFKECMWGKGGMHCRYVFARLVGSGGRKVVYTTATDLWSVNRYCMEVPSEMLMVFVGLGLPHELECEVLDLVGLKKYQGKFDDEGEMRLIESWGFKC